VIGHRSLADQFAISCPKCALPTIASVTSMPRASGKHKSRRSSSFEVM
jgi:hypothetical protein